MSEKQCFKCSVSKPLTEFYRHPKMADGHLNKCKECQKTDVKRAYADNREARSVYEANRNQRAARKASKLVYQQRRRERFPEKEAARKAVGRAVKNGTLVKRPCELCQNPKVQAHHKDYSKPLDVQWLCFKCHREVGHDQVVVQPQE
jgi:hypothetical protein